MVRRTGKSFVDFTATVLGSFGKRIVVAGAVVAISFAATISSPLAADEQKKSGGFQLYPLGETEYEPRLSDEPVPFQTPPDRPPLLVEAGCKFLGPGDLPRGIELPTGAVWTPCLFVFGTFRTALQTYEGVGPLGRNTEWANRLDIFANLQLTSTEKCIVGLGPLDANEFTNFTRYSFESNQNREGWQSEFNFYVRTAFCEGDFGSLFPKLDPKGTKLIDYGFSFGRQQFFAQGGIMINDFIDSVGIVRNNLHAPGFSNIRITGIYAWDSIDRGTPFNRQRRNGPGLFGIFTEADTMASTWNFDVMTIQDDGSRDTGGNGYWIGLSAQQRGLNPFNGIGTINSTYRINASIADGPDNPLLSDGVLLSAEFSITPAASDDIVYFNPFWGIDRYTQAAREPVLGGPLAPLGINFASNSLGNYLSELNAFNTQVAGFALGYQAFWDNHRRNIVFELAGVKDTTRGFFNTDGPGGDGAGFAVQFQQAIGQHVQFQLDGFVSYLEGRTNGSGARAEILVQF